MDGKSDVNQSILSSVRTYDPFRGRDPAQLAMEVALGNFKNVRALRHQKFFMKYIQQLVEERKAEKDKQKPIGNSFSMPSGNLWEVGSGINLKPSIPMRGLPKPYSITDTMPYQSRVAESMLKAQRDEDDPIWDNTVDDLSTGIAKELEPEFKIAIEQKELELKAEGKGDSKTVKVKPKKIASELVSRSDLQKRYGKGMGDAIANLTIRKLASVYTGKTVSLRPRTDIARVTPRIRETLRREAAKKIPTVPGLT